MSVVHFPNIWSPQFDKRSSIKTMTWTMIYNESKAKYLILFVWTLKFSFRKFWAPHLKCSLNWGGSRSVLCHLNIQLGQIVILYPFLLLFSFTFLLWSFHTLSNLHLLHTDTHTNKHTLQRYYTCIHTQYFTLNPSYTHLSPGHRWFCLQANLNENESLLDFSRKRSNPRRLLRGPGPLFGITAA